MRRTALILMLCTGVVLAAKRDVFLYHMTGDDFLGQYTIGRQGYAEGYLAGVYDATQGKGWCAPHGLNPDEIDDAAVGALKKRRGTMHGNAAESIAKAYADRFPCR